MSGEPILSVRERKEALRQEILRRLASLSADERGTASRQACLLLRQHAFWERAASVLFYAPMRSELDIWPVVNESLKIGKKTLLPRSTASGSYDACQIADLEKDVVAGRFGIREGASHCPSLPLNKLDLALVPGVAFDLQGRRLGRGKGFYDRLLPPVRGVRCGVAFDEQLVPEVPVEPHDLLLNCILTPTRCFEL